MKKLLVTEQASKVGPRVSEKEGERARERSGARLCSRKMIPYSRPKLSDFYTLFESKLADNHTLHSGT